MSAQLAPAYQAAGYLPTCLAQLLATPRRVKATPACAGYSTGYSTGHGKPAGGLAAR